MLVEALCLLAPAYLSGRFNLMYRCIVVGTGLTVWKGSAFHCEQRENDITLRHILYSNSMSATGECNGGNITGYSLSAENNTYTSEINVVFSSDSVGQNIVCAHNNYISEDLEYIGNSTIIGIIYSYKIQWTLVKVNTL